MANPLIVKFPAVKTTYFATTQAVVANTPIVLNNAIPVQNIATGAKTYIGQMPIYNLRTVTFTSTSNLSAITFTVLGEDEYGQVVTDVGPGPNNNTATTTNIFYKITSITPSASNAGLLSVGYGDVGSTVFLPVDAWNKNANVTLQLNDIDGTGTVTNICTTALPLQPIVNGVVDYSLFTKSEDAYLGSEIKLSSSSFIYSSETTDTTFPLSRSQFLSFANIPITGVRLIISSGPYDIILLQQGGKF